VNYHAVKHGLDLLECVFLIRRLPPFFRNIGKRLVKSPRVFIGDTGLLHHLLNIQDNFQLDNHSARGGSWEGFVLEDLIRREKLERPHTQFSFWRTATGQEVDLVMERGGERLAFEVKANSGTNPHDAKRLEAMLDDIGAAKRFLMGMGTQSAQVSHRVWNISLDLNPCWLP